MHADVIIHVIDASHHNAIEQAETALGVLKELHAGDIPILTVLNKIDLVEAGGPAQRAIWQRLRLAYPRAKSISATEPCGLEELAEEMMWLLQHKRRTMSLRIPQGEYHAVSQAMRRGVILSQAYEEDDVLLEVELPVDVAARLERWETPQPLGDAGQV